MVASLINLSFNPIRTGGKGVESPPPPTVFCPLLKIFFSQPYLKILDLANLFVSDALMKKKIKQFSFTPLSEHFEIWV